MCKSTCIYEINEVFIGIFKQCVFTNFTFQRQAFYVNFNKYVNASLKFSNPVGTRFLKKTRSHTKIQNFKTKNVLIWEICLKACKMVLYSTFDIFFPSIPDQYIQMQSCKNLTCEQRKLQALLSDWKQQHGPLSDVLAWVQELHHTFILQLGKQIVMELGQKAAHQPEMWISITGFSKSNFSLVPQGFAWVFICRRIH